MYIQITKGISLVSICGAVKDFSKYITNFDRAHSCSANLISLNKKNPETDIRVNTQRFREVKETVTRETFYLY